MRRDAFRRWLGDFDRLVATVQVVAFAVDPALAFPVGLSALVSPRLSPDLFTCQAVPPAAVEGALHPIGGAAELREKLIEKTQELKNLISAPTADEWWRPYTFLLDRMTVDELIP